jgi:hypothetical protein
MNFLNASRKTANLFQKSAREAGGTEMTMQFEGRRHLQQQEKTTKLIEWFVKAALRHAEAVDAMHEEAAAIQVESLDRFFSALHREDGMAQFFTLLEEPNPVIAGMAAVYALREAPERCRPVLVRLAQEPGLIGFRAQLALERWDAGEWSR